MYQPMLPLAGELNFAEFLLILVLVWCWKDLASCFTDFFIDSNIIYMFLLKEPFVLLCLFLDYYIRSSLLSWFESYVNMHFHVLKVNN